MLFLVELDHVKSGTMLTPEAGRAFVEQIIFPTIERAEQLIAEGRILAGGPVAGRIAVRFIADVATAKESTSSLPAFPCGRSPIRG